MTPNKSDAQKHTITPGGERPVAGWIERLAYH